MRESLQFWQIVVVVLLGCAAILIIVIDARAQAREDKFTRSCSVLRKPAPPAKPSVKPLILIFFCVIALCVAREFAALIGFLSSVF